MFTKTEITPSLLRLERQQNDFLKFILNSQFMGVFLIPLEPIDEYAHTSRSYPLLDQNRAKTLPFGAAHTYMAYIREFPPVTDYAGGGGRRGGEAYKL